MKKQHNYIHPLGWREIYLHDSIKKAGKGIVFKLTRPKTVSIFHSKRKKSKITLPKIGPG